MAEPPEDLAFTPEQAARLNKLAEEFVAAVGGSNQDPSDPAYKRRWQEAQWLSDQQFRAFFGTRVFAEMQKQAYFQTIQGRMSH
jgi:hypothetical protein